jgi:hypothetical protein
VPAAGHRRPAGVWSAGPVAARLSGGRHRGHVEEDGEWSNWPEERRGGGLALDGGGGQWSDVLGKTEHARARGETG